jgi:tripartite-type tricarboxylate transporter receptor subunit TctC
MLDRRACAVFAALVLAGTPVFISPAAAEDWPTRPIRILVGFGAGGGTDVTSRIIGDALSEVVGQSIVVENKPGAGGTIAGDIVAKGAKDGYNALMVSVAHTVATATIKAQPYDAVNDFAPVGVVANSAFVVVVRKDFPADNLRDLIAIAQREPGKLNYGSVTIGSTQHITAELLRQRAGIEAQHISFRTTPEVVTALMRGDVSFAVELAHAVRGQVQSGDLKIIAVMTSKRWPTLPDVPTCWAGTDCCSRPALRRRSWRRPTADSPRCSRVGACTISSNTSARCRACPPRRSFASCWRAKW